MVSGRKWLAEAARKIGGRRNRVTSMRLRAIIEPVKVAIPTQSRPGVSDSFGEMMDFTRSTKAVFQQRVCKRQRKKARQTFNSVFYANPIRNPSLYVRMGLSIRLENFSSNDGNSILQC